VDTERAQEITEAALSYLLSNLDDASDCFVDQGVEEDTGIAQWFVQSRYIDPITEAEVSKLLIDLIGADDDA